jgi:flagellar motor switch protein FliN/FliY
MSGEKPASEAGATEKKKPLPVSFVGDVMITVAVELGRVELSIRELLALKKGSVIELEKLAGEALDLYANNNLVGRGEGVVVNDKFGVRVTQVVSPEGINELL